MITPLTAPSLPFQRAGTARNKKHTDLACPQGLCAEQVAFYRDSADIAQLLFEAQPSSKKPLCEGARESEPSYLGVYASHRLPTL
ncbi:MAG TPA: hypothetical protein VM822_01985 [Pseudolabrys sp.]|nr:hypothetical protein [Pseudolabrys sp.]